MNTNIKLIGDAITPASANVLEEVDAKIDVIDGIGVFVSETM